MCHNRPEEVVEAVKSLDDGFDEVIVLDNASEPPLEEIAGAQLIRSDENTGVCGGRNALLEATGCDVGVFIDDDAVALVPLSSPIREAFTDQESLGAVAIQIVRPGGMVPLEHPFRGSPKAVAIARPCAYFVGAGYAVRRKAVMEVGGYDEGLFYSTEEIDLSMSMQRLGWELHYRPDLIVEHRPSTLGRAIAPQVPAMRLRNRVIYVRRHLPIPVAVVHGLVWSAKSVPDLARVKGLSRWFGAIRDGLRYPLERAPLDFKQLRQIHDRGGRVWY